MRYKKSVRTLFAACLLLTGKIGAAQDAPVRVPFDFARREVLVQATINGQGPYPMLLDTGTNPSIIDLPLARKLGLPLTAEGRGGSGGGTHTNLVYATSLPNVGVGVLSAANVDALAFDLSALSRRFGRPLRGVLGHSFLMGHVVQFDYPARIVRFLPAIPSPGTATRAAAFFFHNEDGVQVNGIRVNGLPMRANFDTGSTNSFQFTPHAVTTLRLTAAMRRARPVRAAGFNGAYSSRVGTVNRITIGTITVTRPAVTFWLPGTGHDDAAWGVNIGNAFFQHTILTIDYARKRLTLDTPVHR